VNVLEKKIIIVALLLIAMISTITVSVLLFPPTGQQAFRVLAVSNVYVQNKGSQDPNTGEWIGSYWVILSTSSTYDQHVFYEFNKSEAERFGRNVINGQELIPKATIKIEVETGQPYVECSLTEQSYLVAPEVYGYHFTFPTGRDTYFKEYYAWDDNAKEWTKRYDGPLPATYVNVKETVGDWLVYIPLKFKITKCDASGNVVVLESNDLTNGWLNISGPSALIPITFSNPNAPEETLKIKLEGQLSTGFVFDFPSMIIFEGSEGSEDRKDLVFEKTSELLNDFRFHSAETVSTNYLNYWYNYSSGCWETNPDGSIYVHASQCPWHCRGIVAQTGFFENWYYPKPIYVYEDPPPDPDKSQWKGLIHYLADRHRKLQNWEIDKWGCGWEIVDHKLRVYLPYNSYVWLYTIWISTELADTYVYTESIAFGDITSAYWTSTGTDYVEIHEEEELTVEVKNTGEKGNLYLRFRTDPTNVPLATGTVGALIESGDTYTFKIKARNLGPEEDIEGTLYIECVNDEGTITDDASVRFKLFKKTGAPRLSVLVTEKGTGKKLSGIDVIVKWGTESMTKTTVDGWAVFDLPTQGTYTVEVKETFEYYGNKIQVTVGPGSTTVLLELTLKQYGIGLPTWVYIAIGVPVATTIGVVGYLIYKRRR